MRQDGTSIGALRVLPALEPYEVLRSHFLLRARCRQVGERGHERQSAFDAILFGWGDAQGMIEAAQRNRDAVAPQVPEGEGCSAIAAEAALGGLRAVEDARRTPHPGKIAWRDAGEGGEVVAKGLLAHAAVAHVRIGGVGIKCVTNSTALAAAGVEGLAGLGHGFLPGMANVPLS